MTDVNQADRADRKAEGKGRGREGRPARPEIPVFDLTVVALAEVTPSMRRVVLGGEVLVGLAHEPGQDLMLSVPSGDGLVRRRYTIRRLDPVRGTVDLDVVLHGHGPGARWASDVRPGDRVTVAGPRGKIVLRVDADWHLFVGDDSSVPVTLAWLEALSPAAPAVTVLEVDGLEHRQPAPRDVTWLHRDGGAPGHADLFVAHLATMELPAGRPAVYLNGERRAMREVRELLVGRGVDVDAIALKAYWVRDEANGKHGEPIPEGGFGTRMAGGSPPGT